MSDSSAARERYLSQLRPARIRYAVVVGVIVIGLVVWVVVAYARGEAAHATLRTVSQAPAALALTDASTTQRLAWRTGDQPAIGSPQYQGTVVTFDAHTVRGRDARSGRQTWSYTRTDRTVCTAAQIGGTTIAVYELAGNCDEVSSFASGTGRRGWTRTLDKDGMPLNGRPAFQATPFTFMVTSKSVIYAIDPGSGYDKWTYTRYGCVIRAAMLGTSGALISQDCAKPRCAGVKFCGRGVQLLLRDANLGNGDSGKPNADQIKWNDLGDDNVPVSADVVVAAIDPTSRQLVRYLIASGRPGAPVTLSPAPASIGPVEATGTVDADIVWVGGVAYALGAAKSQPLWARATASPPGIVATDGDTIPQRAATRIVAASAQGATVLDGGTGRVLHAYPLPAAPAGVAGGYPLGSGFLVFGPGGTAAYR
ncbi:PQQ-binding-like beta-propeller repeat protein [uncultured Jatrophihabitans sp.]|uniref:outer membrane protein assembly factor BamB family protein n=1 Tax=uncultured Jatrophihabitans sp. TaxID=1610747 RepID=UPI0035CA58AB